MARLSRSSERVNVVNVASVVRLVILFKVRWASLKSLGLVHCCVYTVTDYTLAPIVKIRTT
jgi:hypothetical protein